MAGIPGTDQRLRTPLTGAGQLRRRSTTGGHAPDPGGRGLSPATGIWLVNKRLSSPAPGASEGDDFAILDNVPQAFQDVCLLVIDFLEHSFQFAIGVLEVNSGP